MPDRRKPTTRARAGAKRAAPKRASTRARSGAAKRTAATRGTAKRSTATRTTAKRSTAKRSTARAAAAKRETPKRATAKRTTARASATRATTGRAPAVRPRLARRDEEVHVSDHDDFDRDEQHAGQPSRPVAIGAEQPGASPPLAPPPLFAGDEVMPPDGPRGSDSPEPRPDVEDPRTENLVGLAALVLAISAFLPWYTPRVLTASEVSGWSSGTWGPIVFFLAVAALGIVVLRRLRVQIAFPVSYALVLEGIGWVSVVGLLLKRLFRPGTLDVVGASWNPLAMGYWLALVAALALALLASRLSKDTPIILLPGWFRSQAGKVGAGLLVVALGAGVAFGFVNDPNPRPQQPQGDFALESGLPRCITEAGFPVLDGVEPAQGFSTEAVCTAIMHSDVRMADLVRGYRDALRDAGWDAQLLPRDETGAATARVFTLSGPLCGNMSISSQEGQRQIMVSFGEQMCDAFQNFMPGQN